MVELLLFLKNYALAIGVMITLLGIVYSAIRWFSRLNLKMEDLEPIRKNATEISKAPQEVKELRGEVKELRGEVKEVRGEVTDLRGEVTDLRGEVTELGGRVDSLAGKVEDISGRMNTLGGNNFIGNHSPLSLNDKGKKLAEKMHASDIASRYKEKLVREAENSRPYQIQKNCFDYARREIPADLEKEDQEEYEHLTDVAFDEGVEIEILMYILGIVLRDQVLEAVGKPIKKTDEDIKTDDIISQGT